MIEPAAKPPWSLRRRLAHGLVLTALLPVLLFGAALLLSQWQRSRDSLLLRLDTAFVRATKPAPAAKADAACCGSDCCA